jgi:hypothetical protein
LATFEDGWICKKCWSANRDSDSRCYRCHSEPASVPAYPSKASVLTPPAAPAPAPPRITPDVPMPTQEAPAPPVERVVGKFPRTMPKLTFQTFPSVPVLSGVRALFMRLVRTGRGVRSGWIDIRRRAAAMRRRAGMFTFWISATLLCWLVIFFELAPESAGGRLVASVLATLGLGLFSAATAAVTSLALAERRGSRDAGKAQEG